MKGIRVATILSLLGLAGCAYENPAAPITLPRVDPSAPSQVTLGASGSTAAGTSTVTARVQNGNGAALPNVIVTFATTRGTISPEQATTGANGSATAVVATTDTADVTASVGALSAHTLVAASTTSPTPAPPTTSAAILNVSSSGTTGVPLAFSVSSAATGVIWTWSFGDGVNTQTSEFTTTHAYGRAGVYTASVSGAGTSAASATITVNDPLTPPATTATLNATVTCPTSTAGHTQNCNVSSVTYGSTPIASASITGVTWDWGDGSTTSGASSSRTYAAPGKYTVLTTVNATTVDGPKTATVATSVDVP